ncbi:MAG: nucleotidyltransferase family protein, partial [Lawsonibacter sp.]|nr:nucleotidyltransferase family protein [Lawsonibacter sp.]
CGETEPLVEVANCLDRVEYRTALSGFLGEGMSFASARQAAVGDVLGCKAELLSTPNNNLGVEYIRALNAIGSAIRPMTVLRRGAAHNSVPVAAVGQGEKTVRSDSSAADMPQFVSATQIRLDLLDERWDHAEPYLFFGGRQLLEERMVGLPELQRVERAVLTRLRTMTAADWAELPDAGEAEGLPRRLEQAGRQCTSVEEFFELAKTKRYTHARLRRLALWAFLGLRRTDVPTRPPYLRVLGFNGRGRELLRQMRDQASLPILTKPASARELDQTGRRLFELEARCTDLYNLCFEAVSASGQEWTTGPVILP